ncbi:MAG: S1C family serine protease [Lentisphaerales bacterium]|nr:S1C family serine protease [Lentisphaerales bacterium]
MIRILTLFSMILLVGCNGVWHSSAPLAKDTLYEKMHRSSLVLLVNGKENGSAAFISADGLAVSAAHCIKFRDDKLEVISPIYGRMHAKLQAIDKGHDVILLKVNTKGQSIDFLPPAKTIPKTPDKVYQYGSPIYRRGVVQSGTIARNDLFYEYYGEHHNHYIEIVHVSATVQGGTSGGPWVNQNGEFIGVQSGTLLVGDSPSGIAFMAPVHKFKDVIANRKSAKSRNLDFKVLPLEAHDSGTIKRYNGYKEGLVVSDIKSESVAKQAGLNKWDMIVAVNDTPVKTTKELLDLIRYSDKSKVALTIVELDEKKSKIKTIPVEIVEDRIIFRNTPAKVAAQKHSKTKSSVTQ